MGRTQKAFGQDTVGIWAGHRRHLGRTQKAIGQDTQGIWAGPTRHLSMTSKAMHTHDTPSTVNKAYLVYTKESPLLMKLPRFANSSLLFLAARSLHLKSVSDCSGLFASR